MDSRHGLKSTQPLPAGFDALIDRFGGAIRRAPWRARRLTDLGHLCATRMEQLADVSDRNLEAMIDRQRYEFSRDTFRNRAALTDALAIVGDVSRRQLGLRPYPVQLMGALALYEGWLVEMATGEGKTLTIAMAAILAAWGGRPCHLVTSNDYLAVRDTLEMGPLYRACGVSVDAVTGSLKSSERMGPYGCDVVYVTAKELLADFLRDRLSESVVGGVEQKGFHRWLSCEISSSNENGSLLLVRGLHTALIDEADSVLIDDAVTPLILSAPRPDQDLSGAVIWASEMADQLRLGNDFWLEHNNIALGETAIEFATKHLTRLPRFWQARAALEDLLRQALVARYILLQDQHYVVADGKIVLVDDATGRLMPGRTLTVGLHQAVEAFQGLPISSPSQTLTQMSFQAFFRHFKRLAGTTGTAWEARFEFWSIYRLSVLKVPPHRPCVRKLEPIRAFGKESEKDRALLDAIEDLHRKGLPVLVGVRSVRTSDRLAKLLHTRGLQFRLLNAVRMIEEAEIVAGAGALRQITIATNMAGRGTDIKLGSDVGRLGGLQVIIAECNESLRIDRQLAGRCGRQGDPGRVRTFISTDDLLLERFCYSGWLKLMRFVANNGGRWAKPFIKVSVEIGLRLARRRAEAHGLQRRRAVLESDQWLSKALPFMD